MCPWRRLCTGGKISRHDRSGSSARGQDGVDLHEQARLSARTVTDDDEFATEFGHSGSGVSVCVRVLSGGLDGRVMGVRAI
jgi:hypothetical protein